MCDCKPINQAVIVAANPYWTGIAANITKNRTQLYAKSLKCMCVCVRYAYALAPTNICLQYVYMCMCMHEKNFKLFIKPSNCLSSYQFCKQAFSIRLICVHTFIHTYAYAYAYQIYDYVILIFFFSNFNILLYTPFRIQNA